MRETSTTHTTSTRRSALLTSLAAITTGLATSGPAAAAAFVKPPPLPWRNGPRPPDPDAALIAACAEAEWCETCIRRINEETSNVDRLAAFDSWGEAIIKVIDTPAVTIGGIRAKTTVFGLATVREQAFGIVILDNGIPVGDSSRLDMELGMSLRRDIEALGGAA